MNIQELKSLAKTTREDIAFMAYSAQSAHMGGALSCVELLVCLYFEIMNVYPDNPYHPKRDRLIFSKAHDAKALYAVLCARGYFPRKFLNGYEKNNGNLPGHTVRHCVPGIEASAGSLGHGLSIGAGVALSGKIDNKSYRVFTILSDGECDEGSIWEAALFAAHHTLNNLFAIVDYNKLQGYGTTQEVLNLEPFAKKWESFGWNVLQIENGHDNKEILSVFNNIDQVQGKPTCIIAHTIKGYGGPKQYVNTIDSQYKPPTKIEYDQMKKV